jgi:hypothetical protein
MVVHGSEQIDGLFRVVGGDANERLVRGAAQEIVADVSTAVPTNHSPRMNCFADLPAVTSIRKRPAVGPTTPMAMLAMSCRPAFSAACTPRAAGHDDYIHRSAFDHVTGTPSAE